MSPPARISVPDCWGFSSSCCVLLSCWLLLWCAIAPRSAAATRVPRPPRCRASHRRRHPRRMPLHQPRSHRHRRCLRRLFQPLPRAPARRRPRPSFAITSQVLTSLSERAIPNNLMLLVRQPAGRARRWPETSEASTKTAATCVGKVGRSQSSIQFMHKNLRNPSCRPECSSIRKNASQRRELLRCAMRAGRI